MEKKKNLNQEANLSQAGHAAKIGNDIIGENTQITITVKTALWIIGIVIALFSSIFTYAYIDVKKEVESSKIKIEQSNHELLKQIDEKLSIKFDKQRDRDDKFIEDIAKIRGDVERLLDRTGGLGRTTEGAPTIGNNIPDKTIPIRSH